MAVSLNLIAKPQLTSVIEFEKNLISTIQTFPYLYATDNQKNKDLDLCRSTWINIANKLKRTVVECLNKWYSLQQIYIHHWRLEKSGIVCREIQKWPHYESFKKIEAYLPKSYSELMETQSSFEYSKPTKKQKDILLKELEMNRCRFLAPYATIEGCQKIWEGIATKLNNLLFCIDMPTIQWQKVWKDMKQSIEILNLNIEDEKILAFCGTTYNDSPVLISTALNNDFEFGVASACTLRRCKKCRGFFDDPSKEYCNECCSTAKTKCDICSKICENELVAFLVKNWSHLAKKLLPKKLQSYNELSACIDCTKSLKKYSTKIWKVCRICETYAKTMDSLYLPSKNELREVFQRATNIKFDEADGLPGYICKLCIIRMECFNNFYLSLNSVQSHLQKIHATNFVGTPHNVTESGNKHKIHATNFMGTLHNVTESGNPVKTITGTGNVVLTYQDPNTQKNSTAPNSLNTDVMQHKSNAESYSQQAISADKVVGNMPAQVNTALVIGQQRNSRVSESNRSGYCELTYSRRTPTRKVIPKRIGETTVNVVAQNDVVITRKPSPPLVSIGLPAKRPAHVVSVSPRESNAGTPPFPSPKVRKISSFSDDSALGRPLKVSANFTGQNSTVKNQLPNAIYAIVSNMAPAKTPSSIVSTQAIPVSTAKSTLQLSNAEKMTDNNIIPVTASSTVPLRLTNSLAKRIPASQPAVFTISPQLMDSERHEDSLPVFCIQKTASDRNRFPSPQLRQPAPDSAAPQVAINTRPQLQSPVTTTLGNPRLPTTAVKNSPQTSTPVAVRGPKLPTTPVNNLPQTSTAVLNNVPRLPPGYGVTISKLPNKPVVKATKPLPVVLIKIPESPSPDIQDQGPDLAILPNELKTEKADVDDTNLCPMSLQDASELPIVKVECIDDPEVHAIDLDASNDANQSSPMPMSYQTAFVSCVTTSKSEIEKTKLPKPEAPSPRPRRDQFINSPSSKRLRKYWGTVSEFQITHEKNTKPTSAPSKDSIPQASEGSEESLSSVSQKPGPSPQPEVDPCSPTAEDLEPIKEEKMSVPATFYPDSFELGSVFLTAEDSSMMRDVLLRSELNENNVHSFKYINPSILMSCVNVDNVQLKETHSTKQSKPDAVNEAKNDVSEEDQANVTGSKIEFRMRKLKVKIKRIKKLRISSLENKKWLRLTPSRRRSGRNKY